MKRLTYLLGLFITIVLFSCSDDDNSSNTPTIEDATLSGKAEKGPFQPGAKMTLYELDENLDRTGQAYRTEITDNAGSFAYKEGIDLKNSIVELEVEGKCYNESTSTLSSTPITINALADISDREQVNINVLTHLSLKRIKALVKEGSDFKQAKTQAEKELLKCFSITTPISDASAITLTDGTEESAILLAVSSIIMQGTDDDLFNSYLAAFSGDFAQNGEITENNIKEEILYAQASVDQSAVNASLTSYYKDKCGKEVILPEFWQYIDRNGDGVLDENDKPTVPPVVEPGSIFEEESQCIIVLKDLHKYVTTFIQDETVIEADYCNLIELDQYHTLTPNTNLVNNIWQDAYKMIGRCNGMIQLLSNTDVSYNKAPYLASMETLRALPIITLTQLWGDIPYITPEQWGDLTLNVKANERKKIADVYTDLRKRLLSARESLPSIGNYDEKGTVSVALADILLATISLEEKDAASALVHLNKIIASNLYELNLTNEPNIYEGDNQESIYSSYYGNKIDTGVYPYSYYYKYIYQGDYHPLYRYTGVMLNVAECYWRQGKQTEAIETLNRLGTKLDANSTSDSIRECINQQWKERLGKEYGYFALLKRLGIALEVMKWEEYQLLFPIPAEEMNRNPYMVQNPGYNKPNQK